MVFKKYVTVGGVATSWWVCTIFVKNFLEKNGEWDVTLPSLSHAKNFVHKGHFSLFG